MSAKTPKEEAERIVWWVKSYIDDIDKEGKKHTIERISSFIIANIRGHLPLEPSEKMPVMQKFEIACDFWKEVDNELQKLKI